MRPYHNRLNAYMLRSGRVILRSARYHYSGGRRIAAGLSHKDHDLLKQVLRPGPANDFFVPEARARHADDKAVFTVQGWRTMAELYRRKIAEARASAEASARGATA